MSVYLKYFTTENDFKKRRTCSVRIKFIDLHTYGTSLRTHMLKQHPELFETDSKQSKLPKTSDFYTENKHDLPALPKLDRVVITICSSKHVLPFDIVEDPIFQWGFNFSGFDRRTISQRVTELAEDLRVKIKSEFAIKFVSIMLDGWTNSITKNHHICFIVKVDETLYYWSSIVVRDKTANSIKDYTISVVDNVEQSGGKVVSCVADNARNVQLALRQISQEKHPSTSQI